MALSTNVGLTKGANSEVACEFAFNDDGGGGRQGKLHSEEDQAALFKNDVIFSPVITLIL